MDEGPPFDQQRELESEGERFPRAEHDDAEVDHGNEVDVPLRICSVSLVKFIAV